MTPLESLMREWLASGTPEQKRHAAARLAIGFADTAEPPPPASTSPIALTIARPRPGMIAAVRDYRLWKQRIDTCLYRSIPSCGCSPARCHAGKGGMHGAVSFAECRACLAALDKPNPEIP